eukprot:1162032-Pelagomonas_calceolata.AAC.6
MYRNLKWSPPSSAIQGSVIEGKGPSAIKGKCCSVGHEVDCRCRQCHRKAMAAVLSKTKAVLWTCDRRLIADAGGAIESQWLQHGTSGRDGFRM